MKTALDTSAVLARLRNDAVTAASLWSRTRAAGLSLGDRCCLALGVRLGLTTVTADTAWADLDLGSPVQIIR